MPLQERSHVSFAVYTNLRKNREEKRMEKIKQHRLYSALEDSPPKRIKPNRF